MPVLERFADPGGSRLSRSASRRSVFGSNPAHQKQYDEDDDDDADDTDAAVTVAVAVAAKAALKPPSRKMTRMMTSMSPTDMIYSPVRAAICL